MKIIAGQHITSPLHAGGDGIMVFGEDGQTVIASCIIDSVEFFPYSVSTGGVMKRTDLLRLLRAAGFEFQEGGRHTKVYKDGVMITQVPRHAEVNELTAKKILKDAGLK